MGLLKPNLSLPHPGPLDRQFDYFVLRLLTFLSRFLTSTNRRWNLGFFYKFSPNLPMLEAFDYKNHPGHSDVRKRGLQWGHLLLLYNQRNP